MQKLIGAAIVAGAALAGGVANAEVSGNINLTTDYVFRGVSLSDGNPAVQGGFDWTEGQLYAGVWGSSLTDGVELDVYGGWTPSTGPVDWDLGLVAYFYPGADDDDAEFDYFEAKAAGTFNVTDQFGVGGAVYYSPENYGDTGEAIYLEVNASYTLNDQLSFSGAYGNQSIDDPDGAPGGLEEDDYNTWNIGGTYAMHGFEVDLRYHDTDIEDDSDIGLTLDENNYDSAVVATISRAL